MAIVTELLAKPGVIAAGEYTYKAELNTYSGDLSDEQALMLSIMGHATTKGTTMQADMLAEIDPDSGLLPVRGWLVRGDRYTLCVVANVFCLLDNGKSSINGILRLMRTSLADASLDLV